MVNITTLFDPEILIKTAGFVGIFFVLFAESGLFFGFFLPGDSLLFTAGVLASQRILHFPTLCILSFIAAVAGDNVGYWFGQKVGPKLFRKEESLLFKKHHLMNAQKFYEKNGAKTIIIARFIPFIRTFAPIVAGAAHMPYPIFMINNILGGFIWSVGLSALGYYLGSIPIIQRNYEYVIGSIIAASVLPIVIHFFKDSNNGKLILTALRNVLRIQ